MFSRLIVGNFKSIRDTVEIDLRPITLLFGPNAAGKSSILHAIHYLAEVLRGGTRDVYQTTVSGGLLDLGGFDQVVHGHDRMGRITLGLEYDTRFNPHRDGRPIAFRTVLVDDDIAKAIRSQIACYRITLTIGRQNPESSPVVLASELALNDDPLAVLFRRQDDDTTNHPQLRLRLNVRNPLLSTPTGTPSSPLGLPDGFGWVASAWAEASGVWPVVSPEAVLDAPAILVDRRGQLIGVRSFDAWVEAGLMVRPAGFPFGSPDVTVPRLLDVLIAEPFHHATGFLDDVLHLGPLRSVPPRFGKYIAVPSSDSTWFDGGRAWATIQSWHMANLRSDGLSLNMLLEEVNRFLHDSSLLSTGLMLDFVSERRFRDNRRQVAQAVAYNAAVDDPADRILLPVIAPIAAQLDRWSAASLSALTKEQLQAECEAMREALVELPTDVWVTLRDVARGVDLALQDVGVGVAQVIPVLVAVLLSTPAAVTMVEQPELHLHPKAQVALGEAVIDGAASRFWTKTTLLETHSEHLLLRLLRRLREGGSVGNIHENRYPFRPEHLAVIYVEPTPGGARVRRLRVDDAGEFVDRWPDGFFDERAAELFA